jgi:regulatory protein
MLDDASFARTWVESRDRGRPRGERALRRELELKGVDRERAAGILDERRESGAADGPGPDTDAARRVVARHARALERVVDPRARRQRAYALLARNGFDSAVCAAVSAEVISGTDDDLVGEPDLP